MLKKLMLVVLSAVVVAGPLACKDDLTGVQTEWTTAQTGMMSQIDGLKKEHGALIDRLKAIPMSSDPASALAGLRKTAEDALANQTKAVSGLDEAMSAAKASIDQAVQVGKLDAFQSAMGGAKMSLDGAISKVTGLFSSNKEILANVEKTAAVEIEAAKAKAESEAAMKAEQERLDKAAADGGSLDFSNIDFAAGKAEFLFTNPASQATLDELVKFMGSCGSDLSVNITGHTSKDGDAKANQKLSEERAAAVKKYLLEKGIKATQILKIAGLGSTKTMVDEPAPDSEDAKKMDPAALQAIRNKNRRITLDVVNHCPAKK